MTETMQWNLAATKLPDSDITVLCWLETGEWVAGWWADDHGEWLDCATGGRIGPAVTHWAEPAGPMQ